MAHAQQKTTAAQRRSRSNSSPQQAPPEEPTQAPRFLRDGRAEVDVTDLLTRVARLTEESERMRVRLESAQSERRADDQAAQ